MSLAVETQVAAAVISYKSRAAFQLKPSINEIFVILIAEPLPEVGTMEILECSECVPGWICHLLTPVCCLLFLVLLFL